MATIIYKVWVPEHQEVVPWIGATTGDLNDELARHVRAFKEWRAGAEYYSILFRILWYEDAAIQKICECPANEDAADFLHAVRHAYPCSNVVPTRALRKAAKAKLKNTAIAPCSKAYQRAYYAKRRSELMAAGRLRVQCECGITVAQHSLGRHRESTKHAINFILYA